MSDSYFPTTHSTLSSEALLSYVQERYDIGDIIQCKFLNQGLNDRQVTFFDFDCCGPGWRAYDIAVFRWSIELSKGGETLWESYLEGYTRNRAIHELDMEAIPLFVAIRHIWLLGLHVHLGADFGSGWLNKQYFDRNMSFLKKWVDEHIIDHKE